MNNSALGMPFADRAWTSPKTDASRPFGRQRETNTLTPVQLLQKSLVERTRHYFNQQWRWWRVGALPLALALSSCGGPQIRMNSPVRESESLVRFSDAMRERSSVLKGFLMRNLYRHPQVTQTTVQARRVVRELFTAYCAEPAQMQAGFAARTDTPRAVADYIAGMTDRFAGREHERLTGRRLLA